MFKAYSIASTQWGWRVFPPEAFNHFYGRPDCSWACLVESYADEEIFMAMKPAFTWLIKSARKRGFGDEVLR